MATTESTNDTSAEAQSVQLALLRKMSPQQRIEKMCQLSQSVKQMAIDAICRRHPEYSEQDVKMRFIELTYGSELGQKVRQFLDDKNKVE